MPVLPSSTHNWSPIILEGQTRKNKTKVNKSELYFVNPKNNAKFKESQSRHTGVHATYVKNCFSSNDKSLVILKGQSKKQVQVNNMWKNALIHMVKVLSLWNKIERALSSVSVVLKLHEQSVEMDGWHVKCQKAVNSMC